MFQTCLHLQVNRRRVPHIHRHGNLQKHCSFGLTLCIVWDMPSRCHVSAAECTTIFRKSCYISHITLHGICGIRIFWADILEHNSIFIGPLKWPVEMELTGCSKTLPQKIQTPGHHPKERIWHSQDSENLKSAKFMTLFILFGIKRNFLRSGRGW